MNDIITVRGIVATEPRHLVTETGLAITSIRVASPSRRWDRSTSAWANGPTNWFTVTAFRSLAANAVKSLNKGDRVIVSGRLRIRSWQRDDRSGTSVEIDAEGIGHDLAWGVATWMRVPRHVRDAQAGPGESPRVDLVTGEVDADALVGGDHRDDGADIGLHPDHHRLDTAVDPEAAGRVALDDLDTVGATGIDQLLGMATTHSDAAPDPAGVHGPAVEEHDGSAPLREEPDEPDDVLERAA